MKQIFFFGMCLFIFSASLYAQSADSIIIQNDSLQIDSLQIQFAPDSIDSAKQIGSKKPNFSLKNKLLNSDDPPVSLAVQVKKQKSTENLFYLITAMVLLLAFLKYFYNRYFTNLFRVFFNTSLRQSQLTDQLLQAKLPSLLFNLFFVISGGLYVYILLKHYQMVPDENYRVLFFSSVIIVGLIYLVKFCTLKFTGWITGLTEVTNTYVFIIFLINKIIGIFLVPFIVIMSFADLAIVKIAVLISLMSIGIFLLLRFFRSYSLLQNQLKISRFHFILYIIGIEILPLLLIYRGFMFYLSKNL